MLTSLLITLGGVVTGLSLLLYAVSSHSKNAPEQNQGRRLAGVALIPLAVSILGLLQPELFTEIRAFSSAEHEALSLTLQYESLEEGIRIYDAPLTLQISNGLLFFWSIFGLAFAALAASWRRLERLQVILLWGSSLATVGFLLQAPVSLFAKFGGDSSIRSFLELSPFSTDRVIRYVIPEGQWSYDIVGFKLLAITILCAPLVTIALAARNRLNQNNDIFKLGLFIGSGLLALACCVQLLSTGMFHGHIQELSVWFALLSVCGALTCTHRPSQALTFSILGLVALGL